MGLARFFDLDVEAEAQRKLRRASLTGRPLGAAGWIKALERATGRRLTDPPRGRPTRAGNEDAAASARLL